MRKQGYSVEGIELSDEKRLMAQKRAGIELLPYNLLAGTLPDWLYEQYDMICMFHVLEHIVNPQYT
jgi:2-polyprenyl-3-methyl-5-hydroxy-6-metoxy-1,4-benzoquinol methylase